MSTLPHIGIFADNEAQNIYLGEIAKMAGFEPLPAEKGANWAVILSCATDISAIANDGTAIIWLSNTTETSGGGVRVIPLPVRAAVVAQAVQEAVARRDFGPLQVGIKAGLLDVRENLWVPIDGDVVRLTEKETALLMCLYAAGGGNVSRQMLLDKVWSYVEGVETHTLETHIYRLRQKMEKDPSSPKILLTQGDGYSLAL